MPESPTDEAMERVREALEYGSDNTPALTREPVFVWTNAHAALDRIADRLSNISALEAKWQGMVDEESNSTHDRAIVSMRLGELRSALSTPQPSDTEVGK